MEKLELDTVKSLLKSVLIFSTDGVRPDQLLKEYKDIVGEDLPYDELGFSTLEAFIQSVPDVVKHKWVNGKLFYQLASADQKLVPKPVSKPTVSGKAKMPKRRRERVRGARRMANRQPLLPTPTGYNRQPLLPTPTGYDFSGSVQRPPETPVNPARYVFSWSRPLLESGLGYDFSETRYHYMYTDSLVPKTERYMYNGDGMHPSTQGRFDYLSRLLKRPFMDDDDVDYEQFRSDYPTSSKRIRLDASPPAWCGPSTDSAFTFRQPRYVYTPRQRCDIATYKRLVMENATTAHLKVCKFFVTTMGCDKGELCWYLHVPGHQLTMPDRDRFNLPRKQCCYYLATGCPWVDRCTRLHVSNHDLTPQTRHKLRLRPMGPCKFNAIHECMFGETCEWNHGVSHVTDPVIGTSPETKMVDKLVDFSEDVDVDCLEDVVKIEHFDRIP